MIQHATNGNGKKSANGNGHSGNGNGNGKTRISASGGNGKPSPARRLKLERLFTEYEKLKNAAKEVYSEIDRVEAELLASLTPGDSVALSDGRTGTIQDNFVDRHGVPRNVSYRPCGVRRFEVTIK